MRRVTVAVVVMLFGGVLSGVPAGAGGARDVAAGGGSTLQYQFGFGATGITSDPSGDDVHGAVTFRGQVPNTATFNGKVTCLTVVGKTAFIAGSADIDLGEFGQYKGFAVTVQDNGEPIAGQPVDLISPVHVLQQPPDETCVVPGLIPEFPLTSGNITVIDA